MSIRNAELQKLITEVREREAELKRTVFFDDFKTLANGIRNSFQSLKNALQQEFSTLEGKITSKVETIESKQSKQLDNLEQSIKKTLNKALTDQSAGMNLVRDKLREFKETDEDALKSEILEEVDGLIKSIQLPEEFDASEILKDIQTIKDEHEKIYKEINVLKQPRGTVSGGVTDMRIRQAMKNIMHTEAPVGDIDGANTTYTVNHTIFAVVGFSLNGEDIPQLPNYTIAGNTIEFSTALPAAYSGKDFEIRYFG